MLLLTRTMTSEKFASDLRYQAEERMQRGAVLRISRAMSTSKGNSHKITYPLNGRAGLRPIRIKLSPKSAKSGRLE